MFISLHSVSLQAEPVSPPWLWIVAAAFAAGCYAGSHVKLKTRFNVNVSQSHGDQGQPVWSAQTVVRKLELKCQCGAVHKFRDGGVNVGAGLEPYPQGDSYVCTRCGRVIDLKQIRQLAGGVIEAPKPA
jgi:hypothetical protein